MDMQLESAVSLRAHARTSVGRIRTRNEDAAYFDLDVGLFVVADGMGGQNAGDVASAMAVGIARTAAKASRMMLARLARSPSAAGRDQVWSLLDRIAHLANQSILQSGQRDPDKAEMGTTLDVGVVVGNELFVAHIGDSRVYLIRDGHTRQLTDDHTVAAQMNREGVLTDVEAAVSPLRSVLSNAVGCTPDISVDHVHLVLRPGDRVLMCTDGLYEYIEGQDLAALAGQQELESDIETLMSHAHDGGGHDNITGVLIEAREPAACDELDDAITTPVEVPISREPFADVSVNALTDIVDQVFDESSPSLRPL